MSYDGSNYQHLVFNNSATGRHLISAVGFAKIFSDTFAAASWINSNYPRDGSLFVANQSLYVIKSLSPIKVTTADHGELSITGDDHTQYMNVAGTRAATGDWSLTGSTQLTATTFGTSSADAMSKSHVNGVSGSGWYAAHGANCLRQRHFAAGSAGLGVIATEEAILKVSAAPTVSIPLFDAKYLQFPVTACLTSSLNQPLACKAGSGISSGATIFLYTQAGAFNFRFGGMGTGVST
jgi:hypothetical protein